ncbi:RNA-binding protein [Clostridium sp. DL1XJH146]
MNNDKLIGRVVNSIAGRDEGKQFLIVDVQNESYVYIADGDIRKLENPKKKKLKHLELTDEYAEEIKRSLMCGEKINNAKIKKYFKNRDVNKEE